MSAPDVAESSRAREEAAEQEPESSEPQRKWVALVSVPVLHGNDAAATAAAAAEGAEEENFDGTYVRLDLKDPPLPSYLFLNRRIAPYPRRAGADDNDGPLSAYILAANDRSACILLQVVDGGNRSDFFLCDTNTRTVSILPPVSYIQEMKDLATRPHLSMGLIADPHRRGNYMVILLYPITSEQNPGKVLYYSTTKGKWFVRGLRIALPEDNRLRNPFSATCVLAHDGRLWWISLAYGVFSCDPCTALFDTPQLRFLPLPDDCEMRGNVAFDPRIRTLLEQRRCVRLSEGKLRFVEIRGLSYEDEMIFGALPPPENPTVRMWTLDDPEGQGPNPWTLEYEVAFAEIWDSETYYAEAGLPPRQVPHVALVDPNDHYVVYFFQGPMLFGVDMREKKVVACEQCLIDRDQIMFRYSRPIVDAWDLSPRPPALAADDDDSAPDDDDVWPIFSYIEEMKRQMTNMSVHAWLSQAWMEWTREAADASARGWRTWQMTPPPPSDESAVNSDGQADDELDLDIERPPTP